MQGSRTRVATPEERGAYLSKLIKEAIAASKWESRAAFAKAVGINPTTLWRLEKGKTDLLDSGALPQICMLLVVPVGDFITATSSHADRLATWQAEAREKRAATYQAGYDDGLLQGKQEAVAAVEQLFGGRAVELRRRLGLPEAEVDRAIRTARNAGGPGGGTEEDTG